MTSFLMLSVCSGSKSQTVNTVDQTDVITVNHIIASGCKTSTRAGNETDMTETFILTAIDNQVLYVKHLNAILNCASDSFCVSVSISNDTINVMESYRLSIPAYCTCLMDYEYKIEPLVNGKEYVLVISLDDKLNIVNFAYSPTLNITTGIIGVKTIAQQEDIFYDLHGRRMKNPRKGLNILHMDDGTIKKKLIK